ncbi:MAG: hypothetical protein ABIN11_05890 [candidate division WOR-3 bacterium]
MIKTIIPVVFKEYFRTDNTKRIFQFIFFIIVPVLLFLSLTLTNASTFSNKESVLLSIDFLITILVISFSLLYFSDPEDKIFEDYPVNYLPVKKFYIFMVIFIFLFVFLLLTFYLTFISVSFLLSLIKINGNKIFSLTDILSFLFPSFLSLPFNLLFSIVLGGFIGLMVKKISEVFEGSFKKFILFLSYFLILLLFRKYFSFVYSFIQKSDTKNFWFLFSVIGISSNILLLILKLSSFFHSIFSILIFVGLFSIFRFISSKEFLLPFQKDIEFDLKTRGFYNISSVFLLIFKRTFTFLTTVFFSNWIMFLILSRIFPQKLFFITFLTLVLYIYLFVFFDRILPSRDENYISILETIPVGYQKFEGVVYFFYYLFAVFPVILTSVVSLLNTNFFLKFHFIKTFDFYLFLIFFPITMSAVFPFYYSFFPNFLSENRKGKKLTKGSLLFVFIISYFLLSTVTSIISAYYSSPELRMFVNNLFWKKGYFVGKTIFYFLILFSTFVHLKSFVKILKSFR